MKDSQYSIALLVGCLLCTAIGIYFGITIGLVSCVMHGEMKIDLLKDAVLCKVKSQ